LEACSSSHLSHIALLSSVFGHAWLVLEPLEFTLATGRQSALQFGPAHYVFYRYERAAAGLIAAFQFKPG
jgi:hypothetical protein